MEGKVRTLLGLKQLANGRIYQNTAKTLEKWPYQSKEVTDYRSAMIAVYELQDVRPMVDLYVYSYMRTCAAYDTTVKALGFDEVRVRYRQQRRSAVREVILQGLIGPEMRAYVAAQANQILSEADRKEFIEDTLEDLEQIDESRIPGLGVTAEELRQWLRNIPK